MLVLDLPVRYPPVVTVTLPILPPCAELSATDSLPVFREEREGGVVERGGVIGVVIGGERGWGVG